MRRLLPLLLLGLFAPSLEAQPRRHDSVAPPVTQLIVKLTPRAGNARVEERLAELGQAIGEPLALRRHMSGGAVVARLQQPVSPARAEALAQRLARAPQVEYAAPDYLVQALLTPDESAFAMQWGLMAPSATIGSLTTVGGANATAAWDITTGSNTPVVAVVDTGVRPHPDFSARLLPGYDFFTEVARAGDGDGRDSDPADPGDWVTATDIANLSACASYTVRDSSWHGTLVTSVLAAQGNTASGIAGVSWGARILPLRSLGRCGGYSSDTMDAIRWAAGLTGSGFPVNPYPARVINLSLGHSGSCGFPYQLLMDQLYAAGVIVVAAAGNDGDASIRAPANCNHVIAVTAHGINGASSTFANIGAGTTLSAPGGGLGRDSTGTGGGSSRAIPILEDTGATTPSGSYQENYAVGTSLSAPHVSGTVALILSLLPDASPDLVRSLLVDNVRPFPAGSYCTVQTAGHCGAGLLDIGKTLAAAAALVPHPNNAPEIQALATQNGIVGVALAFQLSASDADGDPLTFTAIDLPAGATLSTAGAFSWDSPALGNYTLSFEVSDGTDTTGPASVSIVIGNPPNTAPVLQALPDQAGRAGKPLAFQLLASDADGDALTFSALSLPAGATLAADGAFSWPKPVAGSHLLSYQVSDGSDTAGPASVAMEIAAAPESPTPAPAPAASGGGGGGSAPPLLLPGLALLALRRLRSSR
jgi:serine protease